MPIASWNRKFYMAGCGGLCGSLDYDIDDLPRKRRYATALTDSGHWGKDSGDGRWAYNNLQVKEDYAYRAVTETARVAKALIRAFYGAEIRPFLFRRRSNGGRQALMEAQRYAEDFDGIIAGAPVPNFRGFATQWIWNRKADTDTDVATRLERLPFSSIHRRLLPRSGLGCAFDAMDSAVIAFVLPAVMVQWSLTSMDIGSLDSATSSALLRPERRVT